ncbi:MAG: Tad domain-containing protein [Planktotalea arctica]
MRDKFRLNGHGPNKGNAERRAPFKKFKDDEEGSLVIFAVFMVLMIITMGGIGVDLMRSERDRTILQHTLDRAILAAADLDQQQAPQTVVNDYFEAAGLEDFLSSVTVDEGINYKTVGAEAQSITTTAFMKLSGVDTLSATASGVAEERISNVEISMVLDVSGSMGSNNRMSRLKTASRTFIDTVLKPTNQGLISVNIIPYDEHVSAGSEIYNELNVTTQHGFSHCIEFDDYEFEQSGLNFSKTYKQMQHTRLYDSWGFQCPVEDWADITVFSEDSTALKNQINQLQPSGNTHIFMGMKWAAATLDPSFNSVVTQLVASGDADSDFADRPAAFDDVETLKTIVLMTDGVNTSSYRVQDWAYDSPSDYAHWSNWGIINYLNRYVRSNQHHHYYSTKYWGSYGDDLMASVCEAAKDDGIVIWSIGFEVNDHGADIMKDCASSPSHFFRVEGVEISEAFDTIARQINQLRLTQ